MADPLLVDILGKRGVDLGLAAAALILALLSRLSLAFFGFACLFRIILAFFL